MRLAVSAVVSGLCAGCTILTSETFKELALDGRSARGVQYSLPRGTVEATLTIEPATVAFALSLKAGGLVPDPRHQYVLRYRSNPAYDDDILVKTNNAGLLTQIDTTTEDKTPSIIVNIAKALSAFGALEANNEPKVEQTLYTRTFDPFDPDERAEVVSEINRRIIAFVERSNETCSYAGGDNSEAARLRKVLEGAKGPLVTDSGNYAKRKALLEAAKKEAIETAGKKLGNASGLQAASISCKPKDIDTLPSDVQPAVRHACAVIEAYNANETSIKEVQDKLSPMTVKSDALETQQKANVDRCQGLVRLKKNPPRATITLPDYLDQPLSTQVILDHAGQPVTLEADCSAGVCYRMPEPVRIVYSLGEGEDTLVTDMPNGAEIVAVDIRRAFFVKKIQKMKFSDGVLTEISIDKKSELAAMAKLPVTIIEEISKGIQLRVNVTTAKTNALTKEAALLQAQADLAKAKADALKGSGVESARTHRAASSGVTSRPVVP